MATTPEIDGYSDLTRVARGGFGVVYRAHQDRFGRQVAIKVLDIDHLDVHDQQRFERECLAMGRLSWHPNVVAVFDSGISGEGHPYLVMEYLEDGSLADRLGRGPVPWLEGVSAGVQVAGALGAAHASGILHRDLKPENLLVGPFGETKLGDFGIAAVSGSPRTATGHGSFTLAHVAPEVLRRQRPDERSDLYGLASTIYTLIVGAPPFQGGEDERIEAAIASVLNDPAPRVRGVPDDLAELLSRTLAKDPARRPAGAAVFGRALQAIEADHGADVTELRVAPRGRETTEGSPAPGAVGRDRDRLGDDRPTERSVNPAMGDGHPTVDLPTPEPTPAPASPASPATVPPPPAPAPAPPPPPPPPSSPGAAAGNHPVRRRRRTRLLVGAGIVAGLVVTGAAFAVGRGADGGDGSDEYCALLADRLSPPTALRDHDVSVFLAPSVESASIESLRRTLAADDRIREPIVFLDQEAAYDEFHDLFADSPELVASVRPEDLPPSFRVDLVDDGTTDTVAADYELEADVRQVTVRSDLGSRVVDATLNPFLSPAPSGGLGSVFDDGSLDRLDDVEGVAPEPVADDVASLAAAIRDDIGDGGGRLDATTATDEQVAAAERVRDDAADRCGLEPQPPGTA